MSRAIIFTTLILCGSFAHAFEDARIHNEINRLTSQMSSVARSQRLVLLNSFLDSLDKYLRTMPIVKTPAGQDEFAGLNEFAAAIFPVGRMKRVDTASCAQAGNKILTEIAGAPSASTHEAINLVTVLCQ